MHAQYKLFACICGIHRAKRARDAGMFQVYESMALVMWEGLCLSACSYGRQRLISVGWHFEDYHVHLFSSDGDG